MIYNKSNSPEYTKSPEILGYDTAPRGELIILKFVEFYIINKL